MWWQVSDGLLYNYFEDKEDLLASALLAHVGAVMSATPRLPEPGTGTVAVRCQLASQNGRSPRRASTQADPIGSSETAQAHRRLTKLGIPSRLTIDDFGHSTESGRGVKQTEDPLAEPSRIAQRSSVLKPSGWGGPDKVASPTRVDRAPAVGLPAVGLTAILSSNAATLLGLQRQS